jgi:hypothetical protein
MVQRNQISACFNIAQTHACRRQQLQEALAKHVCHIRQQQCGQRGYAHLHGITMNSLTECSFIIDLCIVETKIRYLMMQEMDCDHADVHGNLQRQAHAENLVLKVCV